MRLSNTPLWWLNIEFNMTVLNGFLAFACAIGIGVMIGIALSSKKIIRLKKEYQNLKY